MPQVSRNNAARRFYEELHERCPDVDKQWLRFSINAIASEELRLIKRDLMQQIQMASYYHIASDPEKAVISAGPILRHIDSRLEVTSER